jgi:hypothetical protein
MGLYYDRQGRPIELEEWLELGRDGEYKRLALDVVGGSTVSTVWLGLNHGFTGGPPLIFETMIFNGPLDGECNRYTTELEAIEGHADTLARLLRSEWAALN